jgi:hypothetical protein
MPATPVRSPSNDQSSISRGARDHISTEQDHPHAQHAGDGRQRCQGNATHK